MCVEVGVGGRAPWGHHYVHVHAEFLHFVVDDVIDASLGPQLTHKLAAR